ncbi:hypothetical protein BH11PLA2_BH11PLA2_51910 [soil metagenome]
MDTVPFTPQPPISVVSPPPPVAAVPLPAAVSVPPPSREPPRPVPVRELRIYSHSSLVYWWPVWLMGYIMAALTWFRGEEYLISQDLERFHPSSNLGVIYFLTLTLVILITNVSVRGLVSGLVILGCAFMALLLAYFGWWDRVLSWFGGLKIHMNFGSYFWFSTLLFLMWTISTFIVDRMSYWHIKPGQVTHEVVFGAGSKTYDTTGLVLQKHREDLFRHWLLGVGSGDLEIRTSGASAEQIDVHNVLFIGSKIETMQRLLAEDPMAQ